MLKVKIIHGDAWYKKHVGEIFEVEDNTMFFGNSPHYKMDNTDDNGWTHKLIECAHAEVVK